MYSHANASISVQRDAAPGAAPAGPMSGHVRGKDFAAGAAAMTSAATPTTGAAPAAQMILESKLNRAHFVVVSDLTGNPDKPFRISDPGLPSRPASLDDIRGNMRGLWTLSGSY